MLSDWITVMQFIRKSALDQCPDEISRSPTNEHVIEMFSAAFPLLPTTGLTSTGRKRRPGDLHVSTVARLIRQKRSLTQH